MASWPRMDRQVLLWTHPRDPWCISPKVQLLSWKMLMHCKKPAEQEMEKDGFEAKMMKAEGHLGVSC